MLQTISEHPGFALGTMVSLVAIIGYFIRRVLTEIDIHAEIFTAVKLDLVTQLSAIKLELVLQLSGVRSDIKEGIIEAFNNSCTERQGACSKLQEAKLAAFQVTHAAICAKIARIDTEHKEAWTEQRRWNDKLETYIYRISDGNSSK